MTGGSSYDRWSGSLYVRWNNALGEHFFNSRAASQQVWLTASPQLLDEVGAPLGSSTSGLVAALLAGPPWDPAPGALCRNALAAKDSWRARSRPQPPFPLHLAYLCLFAAAGATGDRATRVNAYYPRLRKLAGLPGSGTPPLFSRMTELWEDLERWSADQDGALGVFRAAGVGQQRHIGLPIAQNLITPAERRALPQAYEAAGLRHGPPPDPAGLADALQRSSSPALKRLRGLLGPATPTRDRELLLGLLAESLRLWREQTQHAAPARPAGAAQPRPDARPVAPPPERGRLALAARLDRAAEQIQVTLRLHLEPFPAAPMQLRTAAGAALSCDEQASGWSTPLSGPAGEQWEASALDWRAGATLTATGLRFRSPLPAGPLRVLQPGQPQGLPHLLETHELAAGQQAVLLAHDSCWPAVRDWAATGAAGTDFRELPTAGLPAGWRLASAARCPDPSALRPLLTWLPGPSPPRLLLDGGLRTGDGAQHSYLDWARPTVRLAGGTGRETLTARGLTLPGSADGRHRLPPQLGPGRHTLQAHLDGQVTAQAHIVLSTAASPASTGAAAPARPASTAGPARLSWAGRRDLLLAPGLWQPHLDEQRRAQRVTLLSRTGQAASWLSTAPPPPGSYVWAIPEGRNPPAAYVGGGEPASEQPLPDRPDGAWLALLTGRDPAAGAVRLPSDEALTRLWQQYQAAARDHR